MKKEGVKVQIKRYTAKGHNRTSHHHVSHAKTTHVKGCVKSIEGFKLL